MHRWIVAHLVHAYCRRRFLEARNCDPSISVKSSPATVIDHVNHIVFWIATSASAICSAPRCSRKPRYPRSRYNCWFPALTMASPLFLAMCVQSTLYCAKNRSRTCGFFLPDGFPVDPVHVTALFVAARVDELIMWDWNIVLWCPYLFWALAVYNCFVYGIVAFDVVRTHAAQCERPIQEQHYAMLVAPNTYVRPYWLAVRSVLRFAVALTSSVCIFVSVHYGALRLNGATELVSTAAMTLPLAVALAVAGILTLVMSWVVAPRLVAAEPHRCSYCAEPIRLLLQIDLRARSGRGRGHVLDREGKDKTSLPASRTVRVLRYENPSDNLTIDLGEQDSTVDGTLLSSTIRRPKDGSVPLRLARAVGKAMWEEFRGHLMRIKVEQRGVSVAKKQSWIVGEVTVQVARMISSSAQSAEAGRQTVSFSIVGMPSSAGTAAAMSSDLGTGNVERSRSKKNGLRREFGVNSKKNVSESFITVSHPEQSCHRKPQHAGDVPLDYILSKTIEKVLVPGQYSRWFGSPSQKSYERRRGIH